MSATAPAAPLVAPRRRTAAARWRTVRAVAAHELRSQTRSVLAWGLALGALGAFIAAIYPSVRDPIEQIVDKYPGGLKEAFGVGAMTSVEGYVHAELFSLMVPLAIGFFAIRTATRPTVGAEERGELDTLLALPLPRAALVAGSMVATAGALFATLALTGALTWLSGRVAGTGISLGLMAAGSLGLWPFAVFFAGVASLAAGAMPRSGVVSGVASAVLVAMYALDLAGRLVGALEPLRWLSAFRYYGAPLRDGLDVPSAAALLVAGVVLAAAGALLLERRDIRAH